MKILRVEGELFHAHGQTAIRTDGRTDRQTDRHAKPIAAFRNFANVPKRFPSYFFLKSMRFLAKSTNCPDFFDSKMQLQNSSQWTLSGDRKTQS